MVARTCHNYYTQLVGPFSYVIKLKDGRILCCHADQLQKCIFTEEQPAIANESTQDFSDVVFLNAEIDTQV